MQIQRLSLLLGSIALASVAWPGASSRLDVEVPPAVAPIQPLAEGRRLVRLPALEFDFGIRASCGPDQSVATVSISIADTRKTLADADIGEDGSVTAAIRLPARQISPVAVNGFCPEGQAESSSLLVRDAVTAHVSLRCTGADGDSITYASRSLDVTLVCDVGPEPQGDAPVSTDR